MYTEYCLLEPSALRLKVSRANQLCQPGPMSITKCMFETEFEIILGHNSNYTTAQ